MEEFTKGFATAQKEPRYTDLGVTRKDLNKLEDYCVDQWKKLKKEIDEIRRSQKK
jgi:hypothetical protein